MATAEIAPDCACGPERGFVNLDKIKLALMCVTCGGFVMGAETDLDTLTEILDKLRARRFRGQVIQQAGQAPEVRRIS